MTSGLTTTMFTGYLRVKGISYTMTDLDISSTATARTALASGFRCSLLTTCTGHSSALTTISATMSITVIITDITSYAGRLSELS